MNKFLAFEDVTVKYRGKLLFEKLNFAINKGEHWAVIGENASIKTDFLRTIAGKNIIAGGSVFNYFHDDFVKENTITIPYFTWHDLVSFLDEKPDFKNLSNINDFYYQQRYNSQDADDAPTVEEYLTEKAGLRSYDGPWTIEKVVKLFHLQSLLSRRLIKLSNGEGKRVRMAAGLVKNPVLFLLDSPYSGLDADMRDYFSEILSAISESGITIVMTTSPGEIPDVITHVAELNIRRELSIFDKSRFNPGGSGRPSQHVSAFSHGKALLGGSRPLNFDTILKMVNVSVKYGDVRVLNNINWEIKPGERWALSGPNGSGKTTLLSLINGDNPQAYANDITLFDRQRGTGESIWEIKSKIGFMSPELHQHFPRDLHCLQVVESGLFETMGLFTACNEDDRERAIRWMELLGMGHLIDFKFVDVSSSQQRMCLLARAMIKNPYLLILDEPCQGMDMDHQQQFREMVDEICGHGDVSLVYVTHYQEEIPSCVDRKLFLP